MQHFLVLFAILYSTVWNVDDPFSPLFNGEDLSGWKVKCVQADKDKSYWKAVDGIIEANSIGDKKHDYMWLMTEKEYGNFILQLKFKAFRGNPGNSGVQIRSRYDDAEEWLDGPQIDINPKGPWRTGMMWDETRKTNRWIFPDLPKGKWVDSTMILNPAPFNYDGDPEAWNELEIKAKGMRIKAWLNGVLITDMKGKGILDDAIHQKYGVGTKGHIALQIHIRDELKMQYKDIEIREL